MTVPRKRWTGEEIAKALDAYLDGKGITAAAEASGHTKSAVSDVIRNDLPRNYRGCVSWMLPQAIQFRRDGRNFTLAEDNYLLKLTRRKRPLTELIAIFGRPRAQIEQRLAFLTPQNPGEGFGIFKEKKDA